MKKKPPSQQTTVGKNKTVSTNFNNHKSCFFIVGDSMVKNVSGFKLTGKVAYMYYQSMSIFWSENILHQRLHQIYYQREKSRANCLTHRD